MVISEGQKQREILGKYAGKRFTVMAIFAAYNRAQTEFQYDTILLKSVTDENSFPLCDHLWVKAPKYVPPPIRPGNRIRVEGRVNEYQRLDGTQDFTLFVFTLKKIPGDT